MRCGSSSVSIWAGWAAKAKAVHWALYLFMIAMPVLGYLVLSYNDKSVFFYGFDLPIPTSNAT